MALTSALRWSVSEHRHRACDALLHLVRAFGRACARQLGTVSHRLQMPRPPSCALACSARAGTEGSPLRSDGSRRAQGGSCSQRAPCSLSRSSSWPRFLRRVDVHRRWLRAASLGSMRTSSPRCTQPRTRLRRQLRRCTACASGAHGAEACAQLMTSNTNRTTCMKICRTAGPWNRHRGRDVSDVRRRRHA